jgi:hypothetical protein
MAVKIGQIYVVRCVEAGQEDWRRLKVVAAVPCPEGEPISTYAVQIPGVELETRDIQAATLRDACDLEVPA